MAQIARNILVSMVGLAVATIFSSCGGGGSSNPANTVTNSALIVRMSVEPSQVGTTGTLFHYTVTVTDAQGHAVNDFRTKWDYYGRDVYNTLYDNDLYQKTCDIQYATSGKFNPTVMVKDTAGNTGIASAPVTVTQDSSPITVVTTISPTTGTTSTSFHMTSKAFYANGQPVTQGRIRWDFVGEGVYNTEFNAFQPGQDPPGRNVHYFVPGTYHVKAQIVDASGHAGTGDVVLGVTQ